MTKQRVLLTGATGFIGHHLVARLHQEKRQVRCLVRSSSATSRLNELGVELVQGDLSDPASLERAVEGCETVFHLGGRVRARNLAEFMETNADGTRNLARAAVKATSPPLLIDVSSLAVAGPAKRGAKRESDVPKPISDYGRSKWAGEQALAELADALPCSVVRPGIVFGEGDMMNLELFLTVKKLGICPIPGWRDKIYSWIHAEDLVDLVLRVAEKGERLRVDSFREGGEHYGHGVYFASTDKGRPLSEIGREIGRSLGLKKTVPMPCPPLAVWVVSTYYEALKRVKGEPQPYDWAKAKESLNHWYCTPEKSERKLGFSPLKPFSERMDQTAAWYRENGLLR